MIGEQEWEPGCLADFLEDKTIGIFAWKKVKVGQHRHYVCSVGEKEMGRIPVEYDSEDAEWVNWWKSAYRRHTNGLCLKDLMNEIMERYNRFKK